MKGWSGFFVRERKRTTPERERGESQVERRAKKTIKKLNTHATVPV